MNLMKFVVVVLVVGFLVLVPIAKHVITKNEVNRGLDVAIYEFQTDSRAKMMKRLDSIAKDSNLDPASVEITVTDTTPTSVSVTIRYESRFRVLFVPVVREVVLTRSGTSLGT